MCPDPTPFFIDSKDAKKIFFLIFFSYKLSTQIIFSQKNLLFYKNFVLKFYSPGIIYLVCSTRLWEKGKVPDPDPYSD